MRGTECGVQNASTECSVRSTECEVQNAEYGVRGRSTECGEQSLSIKCFFRHGGEFLLDS